MRDLHCPAGHSRSFTDFGMIYECHDCRQRFYHKNGEPTWTEPDKVPPGLLKMERERKTPVAPAAEGQPEDLTPVRNVMNRLRQLNPQSRAAELLDKLMQRYSAPSAPQSAEAEARALAEQIVGDVFPSMDAACAMRYIEQATQRILAYSSAKDAQIATLTTKYNNANTIAADWKEQCERAEAENRKLRDDMDRVQDWRFRLETALRNLISEVRRTAFTMTASEERLASAREAESVLSPAAEPEKGSEG